ncbi:endonuclease/exonuclease/phosphatase family protein [Paenibacillus guangzhouensis]|uniref:endonuclease/exonuclease/phosphatase family protein n=1 Tax=Paenibacillus guangzhouensis TaxID=1473112 RepID=UPI0012675A35|nr:endonuclease/exonuclease/phosphatase family protein [Paenibacillus guangzhouensis]
MKEQALLHEMRCMSFNIRNAYGDQDENAWSTRAEMVAGMIRFHRPDIAGLQEVLLNQLEDMERMLPEYGFVGVGRDDGDKKGEFVNVMYRKQRFELLASGSFWLSEQPEQPGSMGWDAACSRVTTWAKFRDRLDGTEFLHMNTHFDHIGVVAVRESAHLLGKRAAGLAGGIPVVLTGDFNCTNTTEPYRILTDVEGPVPLRDASAVAAYNHFGPDFTFHGFDRKELAKQMFPREYQAETAGLEADSPIDFIFVSDQVSVQAFGILADHRAGKFPSDHLPIVADIAWPVEA